MDIFAFITAISTNTLTGVLNAYDWLPNAAHIHEIVVKLM